MNRLERCIQIGIGYVSEHNYEASLDEPNKYSVAGCTSRVGLTNQQIGNQEKSMDLVERMKNIWGVLQISSQIYTYQQF